MASTDTEALDCDSYTTDIPAGEAKHGGISSALLEIEAFEPNPYECPVDTTGVVHSGVVSDSAEMQMLESAGGSKEAISGGQEDACSSETMPSADNDGSRRGGCGPVTSVIDLARKGAFRCDPSAAELVDTIKVQRAARDADAMMAPEEGPHIKESATAEAEFRVSSAEGSLQTSSNDPRINQEVTISSLEDDEARITVPSSVAPVTQEVTSTRSLVSNQKESFVMSCSTSKIDATFSNLEEDQEEEHEYDIDFDIDPHDMPLTGPFFDDHMFPALVGDKTEAWHTGEDDIIMEEGSDQQDNNQHANIEVKSISVEGSNESIAIRDGKENVESREGWPDLSQQQLGCETVSADPIDEGKETSGPTTSHMQGHMVLAGYSSNEAEIETVASGVVQNKELACGGFEGADARESHLQYVPDDIFASLSGENVETIHASVACEAKRLELEVNTKTVADDNDIETTSIDISQQDTDVHLYELDQSSALDAATKDVPWHMKPEDALEHPRLERLPGQGETAIQVEIEGKDESQGSGCLDSEKRDECSDIRSEEADADDQLMTKDNSSSVDGLGVPCADGQASTLNANIASTYVPMNTGREEIATVFDSTDTSLESVSEWLSQEERTIVQQTAMQNNLTVENSKSQLDLGILSHAEANTLDIKQVLNQGNPSLVVDGKNPSLVVDGKSVDEFDDAVLAAKNSDVKEICAVEVETLKDGNVGDNEEIASDKVYEQSERKFVDSSDGSVPDLTKIVVVAEIHASGDEIKEECKVAEQEREALDEKHKQRVEKIVKDFDGSIPVTRNSDTEVSFGSGDRSVEGALGVPQEEKEEEDDKVAEQEGKALDEKHKQSVERFVVDFDGSMPETRNSDVEEFCGSGDGSAEVELAVPEEEKGKEKVAEQERIALHEKHKQSPGKFMDGFDGSMPVTRNSETEDLFGIKDGSVEGELAVPEEVKEEEKDKVAEQALYENYKESVGKSVDCFDGSMPETRNSDTEESFGNRDGSVQGESAPERVKEASNEEPEGHCAIPLAAGILPSQAGSSVVANKQEFSSEATIHPPSSLDLEMRASFCTDLPQKVTASDGLKDSEKSPSQTVTSLEKSRKLDGFPADACLQKSSEKRKFPKAEVSKKLSFSVGKEAKDGSKNVHVGDDHNANCHSELDEELPEKKPQKAVRAGSTFGIGDLVWAKVRSHPWWPAQIFDPADASKSARKLKKSGRVLVAFFGDCTFAWLQQSQMIGFRPNFQEKVQQTTMRIFCLAVEEALEELCRRSELGLSCKHIKGSMHSTSSFPDANTGIRQGVRAERLKDIRGSAEMFRPKKTLEFVRSLACSPLGAWSGTLQWGESRGHAYGLRTCMVAVNSAPALLNVPAAPSQGLKLKRRHPTLDAEDLQQAGGGLKESRKAKKLKANEDKRDSRSKGLLVSGEGMRRAASINDEGEKSGVKGSKGSREENNAKSTIKIKLSIKTKRDDFSSSERRLDTASSEEVGGEAILDDSKETLLAIAGHSAKALKRSGLKEEKVTSSLKKVRMQTKESSKNDMIMHRVVKASPVDGVEGSDADASVRTETETEDAYTMVPSPSRAGFKKTEVSNSAKDKNAGKSDSVRKLSKVGDSLRKVASELTGTAVVAKVVDDPRCSGPDVKKKMKKTSALERKASPMRNKDVSNVSSEDVSLLQLRRDLELLTKKTGSGGAKGKAVKQMEKVEQGEASAARSSPQGQSVPHKSQKSGVQELALAARKRKSEIVHDEVFAKLPKNSSTVSSNRHHASKGYISSAEKPGERGSNDKSLLLYSRRPAPPAVAATRSSSQRYNEKLSSHMPLGLFMRFPEDFPLPSEAQLKATFIPFGPLQMSATRLYKDSASAQVVFKHGRDAESALKHAKKNPMFGQVAVTYRLRHLSHSTRVDGKTDTSPAKAVSESATSRAKLEGSSVSKEKRAVDLEVASTVMQGSRNHGTRSASEPTGDIQDQMMTLLRQVSVIVNTSPVTSDGT